MPINIKKLLLCIAISLALCVAHISGNTILILGCLAAFMALIAFNCITDFTFPVLLFFLPWGPVLRTDPESFSFYTFALIMVCALSVLKKKFRFKQYHLILGFILLALTILSKLLDGSNLSFDYIAFIMLLFVFPVVKEEWLASKYNFTQIVCFFSMGVIMAALCAMSFAGRPNIAKFINVHSYLTITRRCGFYGDPNFYTAQITAALGGALMDLLQEKKKGQTVFQFVLIVLLVYCGFLSGSKSFVLTTMCMLVIWSIALFRMRGRIGFKLITIFAALLVVVFIATSVMFRDLIDVLQTRFSFSNNLSDFTTGRTELWKNYAVELLTDWKTLFLGKGFTNIKVGGKSSHNTILQMVYQFGLIGFVPLLAWSVCFFLDAPSKMGPRKRQFLSVLLLVTGAFLPWLAIDALFFDEFFLLQMYVYMGCRYLGVHAASADETTKIAAPETEDGK